MSNLKKRSDNWTSEDKMLLLELVRERVQILENKSTDTNTNSRKLAAWADLLKSFNIMRNGAERTVAQLRTQWGNLKTAEKRKLGAEKRARFGTGGGPPPREDPTDASAIRAWLPQEFETDINVFDSDSINQVLIVGKSAATATATCEEVIEEQEPLPEQQEAPQPALRPSPAPQILEVLRPTAEVQAPSQQVSSTGQSNLKTKKRKITQSSGQSAADIAAIEIKCRKELHKIQLENEERRKENEVMKKIILELKEQLLLTKIEYLKSKKNVQQFGQK